MAPEIRPFRPYTYSRDFEHSVSPPFDTISEEDEKNLKNYPYNITHLTLPGDSEDSAREKLDNWIGDRILTRPDSDSVIVVEQKFSFNGARHIRYGIITLVRINPDDGGVIPHEKTFESQVKGRVKVMGRLSSQLEPIFLTSDCKGLTEEIATMVKGSQPDMNCIDSDGTVHCAYLVRDAEKIEKIRKAVSGGLLLVADGHQRLEATRRLSQISEGEEKDFWSYVMAYVTPMDQDGLVISGIHRVLKKKIEFEGFRKIAGSYFDFAGHDGVSASRNMVIYDGSFNEIIPKEEKIREELRLPPDEPLIHADMLNRILFGKVLGLASEEMEYGISYIHDVVDAVEKVNSKGAGMAIIMPEWEKDQFLMSISGGKSLPQKSTYFYPKVPSGIAINAYGAR